MNLETFQRKVVRTILDGPWKHSAIGLFGAGSFALGATMASIPNGAFYLLTFWLLAIGAVVFTWKE